LNLRLNQKVLEASGPVLGSDHAVHKLLGL
jgi:hypothetical protein